MPWREVEITYHMDLETAGRAPSDHYPRSKAFPGGYVERTENIRVARDYLDVVFDFVFDILRTFWKNVFITSRCSHPHQYVRQEWDGDQDRSEEHTSELQSLMRISYAVFCWKKKNNNS